LSVAIKYKTHDDSGVRRSGKEGLQGRAGTYYLTESYIEPASMLFLDSFRKCSLLVCIFEVESEPGLLH
jgi:hypothetical protein